jgi:dUTP pyrophosphatase
MSLFIDVVRLPHSIGLPLPYYATEGAAAVDLSAAIPEDAPVMVDSLQSRLIPTGLRVEVPPGHELQVRSRSGLPLSANILVGNSPGTVDEDYRGELGVILTNVSAKPYTVRRGQRIAQAVIAPVLRAIWLEATSLPETERSAGGFGSTGI